MNLEESDFVCPRIVRDPSHGRLACWAMVVVAFFIVPFSKAQETRPAETSADSKPTGVDALIEQSRKLAPLLETPLARWFLTAASTLPRIETRSLHRNREKHAWLSDAAFKALDEGHRAEFESFPATEDFYYNTAYGSPLIYGRVLDLAAKNGLTSLQGKRVMDFGYGSIGQLKLMASLGAEAVGVDPSDLLIALYHETSDQGPVALLEGGLGDAAPGRVRLVHRYWPAEPQAREAVGGGFDLITSKNTLKNGYIHPEKPVDPQLLVHLGVEDGVFVKALFEALRPGGLVVIYNLSPAPSAEGEPYKPWADGRSPFPREIWAAEGFEVLALDESDDATAVRMFQAVGYPATQENGAPDLFARYTIARRPR